MNKIYSPGIIFVFFVPFVVIIKSACYKKFEAIGIIRFECNLFQFF